MVAWPHLPHISPSTGDINQNDDYNKELKPSVQMVLLVNKKKVILLIIFFNLSNNFTKLCCILSYIFRFYLNVRNPKELEVGSLKARS